jgi:SRSO17 transposase
MPFSLELRLLQLESGDKMKEDAARWAGCLDEVLAQIARRFARSERRRRTRRYLLRPIERKNAWLLAAAAGEASPSGYQELLSRAQWDADAIRDDLLDLVREQMADLAIVVVIDDTSCSKRAPHRSG